MKDEKLLSLLKREPESGMQRLVEEYGGLVTAVIRSRLSGSTFCPADVEDCAAQTFAEFYFGVDSVNPAKCGIKGLLCVIAKRNALDMLRRFYTRREEVPLTEAEAISADGGTPESALVETEDRAALIAAVRALGHPDSDIIIRKYFLGQSSAEIAKKLKLSTSNVDTRTHRAIKKLQKSMEISKKS